MSSAETPRFDAGAAAQQMLDLEQAAARPSVLPAQSQSSPGALSRPVITASSLRHGRRGRGSAARQVITP